MDEGRRVDGAALSVQSVGGRSEETMAESQGHSMRKSVEGEIKVPCTWDSVKSKPRSWCQAADNQGWQLVGPLSWWLRSAVSYDRGTVYIAPLLSGRLMQAAEITHSQSTQTVVG